MSGIIDMHEVKNLIMFSMMLAFSISVIPAFAQVSNENHQDEIILDDLVPSEPSLVEIEAYYNNLEDEIILDDLIPSEDQLIAPVGYSNELVEAQHLMEEVMFGNSTHPITRIFENTTITFTSIYPANYDGDVLLFIAISKEDQDQVDDIMSDLKEYFYDIPYAVGEFVYTPLSSPPATITQTQRPNLAIPDNSNRQGTTDAISITQTGTISTISVQVDITHTYQGDLIVDLVAPNGEIVVLHRRSGGNTDNIRTTYTSTDSSLRSLVNDNTRGTWTLRVGDYAGSDTGRLNSWTLSIVPNSPAPSTSPTTQTTIFEDDFENGLGKWIETGDGDWRTGTQDLPQWTFSRTAHSGNIAEADNCDNPCILTLRSTSLGLTVFHA